MTTERPDDDTLARWIIHAQMTLAWEARDDGSTLFSDEQERHVLDWAGQYALANGLADTDELREAHLLPDDT